MSEDNGTKASTGIVTVVMSRVSVTHKNRISPSRYGLSTIDQITLYDFRNN